MESTGEADVISDKPFGAKSSNDAIGLGGGSGGVYRGPPGGNRNLRAAGGAAKTVEAVRESPLWLAKHQASDGSWEQDVETTSLGLLPFLGAGSTHRGGPYKDLIAKGLKYLRAQQGPDGAIGTTGVPGHRRAHAIATLVLSEAYAQTRSAIFKGPAERALDYLEKMRTQGSGWSADGPDDPCDLETTGWALLARRSAAMCNELNPSIGTVEKDVLALLERLTDPQTGAVAPDPGAPPDASSAAVAALVRQLCGQSPASDPRLGRALGAMAGSGVLDLGPHSFLATLAAYRADGEDWKAWSKRIQSEVLERQLMMGEDRGSWPIPSGGLRERIQAAAIGTLCLEVYYRYGWVAGLR